MQSNRWMAGDKRKQVQHGINVLYRYIFEPINKPVLCWLVPWVTHVVWICVNGGVPQVVLASEGVASLSYNPLQPQQWPAPGLVSRQAWFCEMGHQVNHSDSKCEYVRTVKLSTGPNLKRDPVAYLHAFHLMTTLQMCPCDAGMCPRLKVEAVTTTAGILHGRPREPLGTPKIPA